MKTIEYREYREKLYKKFKKEMPETVGEKDRSFDVDNFCDWLCNKQPQIEQLQKENEDLKQSNAWKANWIKVQQKVIDDVLTGRYYFEI